MMVGPSVQATQEEEADRSINDPPVSWWNLKQPWLVRSFDALLSSWDTCTTAKAMSITDITDPPPNTKK
jgi:hypothetical protein